MFSHWVKDSLFDPTALIVTRAISLTVICEVSHGQTMRCSSPPSWTGIYENFSLKTQFTLWIRLRNKGELIYIQSDIQTLSLDTQFALLTRLQNKGGGYIPAVNSIVRTLKSLILRMKQSQSRLTIWYSHNARTKYQVFRYSY